MTHAVCCCALVFAVACTSTARAPASADAQDTHAAAADTPLADVPDAAPAAEVTDAASPDLTLSDGPADELDVPADESAADVPEVLADAPDASLDEPDLPADVVDADTAEPDDAPDVPDVPPPPPPTLTDVTWVGMPAPATVSERADAYSTAAVQLSWSDGTTTTQSLAWHLLFRTGDVVAGHVAGAVLDDKLQPLNPPLFSDCPDGTTILPGPDASLPGSNAGLPGSNAALHMVTHYEYVSAAQYQVPATISLVTLTQALDGTLTPASYQPVVPSLGVWIPCAASRSPWLTHLGSEEYEPDARCVEAGNCAAQNKLTLQAPDLWFGQKGIANPYDYGLVPEITLLPGGNVQIVKHRALGRLSREHITLAPDQRTAYMGDDGSHTAMFLFVADQPGQLDAGTLYAAKWLQKTASNGGSATLKWVRLGHGTDAEIEKLAQTTTFSQVFATSAGPQTGFQRVHTTAGDEWLQVKPGQAHAAAFLESRRYAAVLGATTEFNKMEGTALDADDKWLFVAMSYVLGGMQSEPDWPVDDIQVPPLKLGALYRCALAGGQVDSEGKAIDSDWVATDMAAVLTGTELAQPDAWGNHAAEDAQANLDNLKYAPLWHTLFIGEDSDGHASNYLWAYRVDTGKLTRLLTVPEGAEVTGLFPFVAGGHGYLTVHFQHPGAYIVTPGDTGKAVGQTIAQKWGGNKQAGVGYLSGLPAVGP